MAHGTIPHTAEFKQEAVRLVTSSGKSCAQIARDLGLAPHLVVRWKKLYDQQTAAGRPVFTGRGVAALSEQEARTKQLERELEITRQERDILKKLRWQNQLVPLCFKLSQASLGRARRNRD